MTRYLAGSLSASTLEELDISYNKLSDQGIITLAPVFSKLNQNCIKVGFALSRNLI